MTTNLTITQSATPSTPLPASVPVVDSTDPVSHTAAIVFDPNSYKPNGAPLDIMPSMSFNILSKSRVYYIAILSVIVAICFSVWYFFADIKRAVYATLPALASRSEPLGRTSRDHAIDQITRLMAEHEKLSTEWVKAPAARRKEIGLRRIEIAALVRTLAIDIPQGDIPDAAKRFLLASP